MSDELKELQLSDPRHCLKWALEMLEMYESRLIQFGDLPHLVHSETHERMRTHAIAAARAYQWIDVRERLPKLELSVEISDGKEIATSYRLDISSDDWGWTCSCGCGQHIEFNPTHWREIQLPNPPKEGNA